MRVNTLRGIGPSAVNARRTECTNGHPLEGENLYLTPDGRRKCRECVREAGRQYDARNGWRRPGDQDRARERNRERTRRYRVRLAEKVDMMRAAAVRVP